MRRVLLGLASAGVAALGAAAAPALAAQAPPAFVPVRVALDAGPHAAQPSGATVVVRDVRGRVIGRDTTGSLGVSFADLRVARAPRTFTVAVSGGTVAGRPLRRTLRTDVRDYRAGETVIVDDATTLAARHRRVARVAPAMAEAHVKRRLGLPGELRLGRQVIGAHGAPVARVGSAAGLATPSLVEGVAALPGPMELLNIGLVLYMVYEDLFGGSGSGSSTNPQLTQIESNISTLQSSVNQLTTEVTSLGYSNGANQVAGTIANVVSAYTTYTTLMAAQQQTGGDANSSAQAIVATYGSQMVGTQPLTSLGQITAGNLPTIVSNAPSTSFVGAVRADGLTTTASAIQIATVAGANPGLGTASQGGSDPGIGGPAPGASGLVSQASQASTSNVRWFDADDAAVAAAVWRYYADAFAAAANVTAYYQLMTTVAGLTDPLPNSIPCNAAATSTDATVIALETNIAQMSCYQDALQALQPTPFPAATVLDLTTYTMWSTQIGAQLSQPAWQALNGTPVTLTPSGVAGATQTLVGAAPATPSDANGNPLADWQVATATQLGGLYANATTGSTLTSQGGFDPALLYPGGNGTSITWPQDDNAYWGPDGYSTTVRTSKGCATTSSFLGCSSVLTPYVPLLSIGSCTQPCMSPSYAGGTTLGLWDLNAGGDLYSDPATSTINQISGTELANLANVPSTPRSVVSSPSGAPMFNWSWLYNWNGAYQSCDAFLALGNSSCDADSNTFYPDIQTTLSNQGLPSLFYRTPTTGECYYWPAGSGSAPPPGQAPATQPSGTTNGCPGA